MSSTKKRTENLLREMLNIIKKHPGIRASEINRAIGREHTWPMRKKLIERGVIRKERDGAAVRYYPTH